MEMASKSSIGFLLQSDYVLVSQQPGYSEEEMYSYQTTLEIDDPQFKLEGIGFIEKSIRVAFIRKVYGILVLQLLLMCGFVAVFVLSEDFKSWSQQNFWFVYVALAVSFLFSFLLICCDILRRKTPANYVCLAVFTIVQGFVLGTISSAFDADAILLAVGITAVICFGLAIFSCQTKVHVKILGSILCLVLFVFVICGTLIIFLPEDKFPMLHIVYACFGALIFSIYLIYDTQLMTVGKHKYSISHEEHIFATLNLYLDIVHMCIDILPIRFEYRND